MDNTKKKKTIKDVHKVGDIIFVKKEKNFWSIKTISKSKWRNCYFRSFYWRCFSFGRWF